MPRSPTISRAMAPYVVSDVTTLTLSATGARTGGGVTRTGSATSSAVSRRMSVGLVFVWSNRPNSLQGELVRGVQARGLGPGVLPPELHPLALPQRERGDHLPRDNSGERVFDVIVSRSGDPTLAEFVGGTGVPTEPCRAGAGVLFAKRVQLAAQRPLPIQRLGWRPPREAEVDAAHLGTKARFWVCTVQRRAADLGVGRARQLPEIEQVNEIRRPAAAAEQLVVALAAGQLGRQLVHAEPPEGAVQGDPRSREPVFAQIGPQRKRVFGLRERVQVPAVQLAELLAEFADVEADAPRQAGPVRIPFLDADVTVFEAHEDLGARVGIEWRLEPHLELVRIEVVPLHPRRVAIGPNVAGRADFGVELRLAALASNELRAPGGVTPDSAGVGARRGRGGGAQRRERRVGRWLGGRQAMSELRPHVVESCWRISLSVVPSRRPARGAGTRGRRAGIAGRH